MGGFQGCKLGSRAWIWKLSPADMLGGKWGLGSSNTGHAAVAFMTPHPKPKALNPLETLNPINPKLQP